MKKLIFTVTNDLTYDQRMDRICSTLANNGYDVLLVGRHRNKSVPLRQKAYKQKRLRLIFEKGKLFYIEYNLRLFFYLLFKNMDVICAIDLDTLVPGYLASKIKRKVLVYDAHEYFTEVIEVVNRPSVKRIWEGVERFIVPRLKYAYTVNESLKRLFEDKYHVNFDVIRNLSLSQPLPTVEKKDKYIIYAGAVNEGRGLDECIEAIKSLTCKLYICGDGDITGRLQDKVKTLGLQDKVVFTGYVEPEKLRDLINRAWIGVLLLENKGKSYYFSLANKFFDYLHAGIPQVTINFPEYIILNDTYQVASLIPLDAAQLVEAVRKLEEDEDYYQLLSKNALKASKELNWNKESEKLLSFYESLFRSH